MVVNAGQLKNNKKQQEHKMDVAEMKMLRWMSGYTIRDRIRNDYIRERVGVAPISEKW